MQKDKSNTTSGVPDEQVALNGFHCLVVDDDEVIANAVSSMLRRAGASVQTTNSPAAATDICREASIDVLFTDLVMDGIDGLELMDKIRNIDNSVGIVLMTSHAAPEILSLIHI